jgi:hypothetical protein
METFIQRLAAADDITRRAMLAGRLDPASSSDTGNTRKIAAETLTEDMPVEIATTGQPLVPEDTRNEVSVLSATPAEESSLSERFRDGRMRRMVSRQATQFFGGTSLVQMNLPAPSAGSGANINTHAGSAFALPSETPHGHPGMPGAPDSTQAEHSPIFEPHGSVCRQLVSSFFANCYHYNHFIYREFFLRDYATESGPYYSAMLLYAICAVGATVSQDPYLNSLHSAFASLAGSQALKSLDSPDLTTLQTLMICGPLEVGQGRDSKGWLFCGMAFRLAHEMGLHLDPSNWDTVGAPASVDREILRRVYWATFVADKQMSLYFGRPPALYPQEADVRNTIRIPYPPEWEDLLDTYIAKGTSATAFEDGIAVVGSFVHRVELAKIFHTMIVTIFENRDVRLNSSELAQATHQVHLHLERWLSQLPQKLQWNAWKVEKVPHYILHLHMAFHTGMIILHRPPSRCSDAQILSLNDDVDICYHSLAAILSLLSSYERHYSFRTLPLDIVHTLAAAARIILLKKQLEQSSWTDMSVRKPMNQIIGVMEAISTVWPCVVEIKAEIKLRMEGSNQDAQGSSSEGPEVLRFLDDGYHSLANPWPAEMGHTASDSGFLFTDESLNNFEGWGDLMG